MRKAVRMRLAVSLAALVLAAIAADATAARCRRCTFAGLCRSGAGLVECVPSETRCVPNGGILAFNSPAPMPAYWTLFANACGRRSLGRLDGRLEVRADYTVPRPNVPGLPAECDATDAICFGTPAELSGVAAGDRFTGVARYPDGSTCEFSAALAFGFGGSEPNSYVCRGPTGEIMSQGDLQLQLIRLRGCRSRRR